MDQVLSICGTFPFLKPLKESEIIDTIKKIGKKSLFDEFISYFIWQCFPYLQKYYNLLDYKNISKSFRCNSFIENYNGRIKILVGNKSLIQWPYKLKDTEPR